MAKVRCAKCGEIFGLQTGDIQVCPVCGCRMKVNRKPQSDYRKSYESAQSKAGAPISVPERSVANADEYDTLRREYMDMMREKLEKNKKGEDGVFLSRDEYDALVKKAATVPAASAPAYEPAPQRTPPEAPAYSAPVAPAPDDYARYDAPNARPEAQDDAPAKKKFGAKSLINWLSFLFALLAGVMSALLLVLDALKDVKGMDMFLPAGAWTMPQSITVAVIFFAPALFAIYALVSSAVKGKVSKFILMLLYLVCGAAMLFMPFFYSLSLGVPFDVANIASSFGELTIFDILAIVIDGLAFLAMFVAGVVVPKKRKAAAETDDELL